MAIRLTQTPTPSITPTLSLSPTKTPTQTPTQTSCPCICNYFIASNEGVGTNQPVAISVDGINWSASTNGTSVFGVNKFTFNAGYTDDRFVLFGRGDGIMHSYYSLDNGFNWTEGTISWNGFIDEIHSKVIEVGNKFFMCSQNIFDSNDGVTWNTNYIFTPTPPLNVGFQDITTNGYRMVAVKTTNANTTFSRGFLYSDDAGASWSSTTDTVIYTEYKTVNYQNGLWIAGGLKLSGKCALKSTDGINWVDHLTLNNLIANSTAYLEVIAVNGSMWVIGVDPNIEASPKLYYSYDGENFTAITTGPTMNAQKITDIVYNIALNRWVAVGVSKSEGTEYIFYSNDGINWIEGNGYKSVLGNSGAASSVSTCCNVILPPPPSPSPTATPTLTPTVTPSGCLRTYEYSMTANTNTLVTWLDIDGILNDNFLTSGQTFTISCLGAREGSVTGDIILQQGQLCYDSCVTPTPTPTVTTTPELTPTPSPVDGCRCYWALNETENSLYLQWDDCVLGASGENVAPGQSKRVCSVIFPIGDPGLTITQCTTTINCTTSDDCIGCV